VDRPSITTQVPSVRQEHLQEVRYCAKGGGLGGTPRAHCALVGGEGGALYIVLVANGNQLLADSRQPLRPSQSRRSDQQEALWGAFGLQIENLRP
jgi:hypothetical protein